MGTTRIKKGNKFHYIYTLKKSDGSIKSIHIGNDPFEANNTIRKFKLNNKTPNKLHDRIESLQYRLKRIANHGKSLDTSINEIRQKYHSEKSYMNLIKKPIQGRKIEQIAILATMICSATIFLGYVFLSPMITGFAVVNAEITLTDIAMQDFTSLILVALVIITLGLSVIHIKYHKKTTKHNKYKR